jgi:precorrin-3B synthase
MTMTRTLQRSPSTQPADFSRRGACPTLARPMQTGDGLLARLRPIGSRMTFAQLRALAEATAAFGNGIVEITARGSLQARGLMPATVAAFETAVLDDGIDIATGVGIETPPLAGLDANELLDVRPLAAELRRRIADHAPALALAPKLAITLDGGGRFHLGAVSADLKVAALRDGSAIKFLLSIPEKSAARTSNSAVAGRAIAIVDSTDMIGAVVAVLEKLAAIGPSARGRDLDLSIVAAPDMQSGDAPLLGIHIDAVEDQVIIGVALAYCQASSASLVGLADAAIRLGAGEIRLAPGHGLFITGLTLGNANELQETAAKLGFLVQAEDPRRAIALCAGSTGCASAHFDTHALADGLLAHAPDLLDGSIDVHLSGCAKGCAHPAAAPLALVGARAGYGLVVNGAASADPALYIAENDIKTVLTRLQALVRQSKEEGESAGACLARLGPGAIVATL